MGFKEVAYKIYEFFLDAISSATELNAFYYSGKEGCKGIYWKDKDKVLEICSDAICKSCGEKVQNHNLS